MSGERADTEILTLKQGAQHLGMKPNTFLIYVRRGLIPFHTQTIIRIPGKRGRPNVLYTFLKHELDGYIARKKKGGRPKRKGGKGRRYRIFEPRNPEYENNITRLKYFLYETDLTLQEIGKEFNGLSKEAIRLAGIRAGIYFGEEERGTRAIRAKKKRERALLSSLALENLPWWYRAVWRECLARNIQFEPCYIKKSKGNLIVDYSKARLNQKIVHLRHTDRAYYRNKNSRTPYSLIWIGAVRSNEFLCAVRKWKDTIHIFIFHGDHIAQKERVELPTERKISYSSGAHTDSWSKWWDFEGDNGWVLIMNPSI